MGESALTRLPPLIEARTLRLVPSGVSGGKGLGGALGVAASSAQQNGAVPLTRTTPPGAFQQGREGTARCPQPVRATTIRTRGTDFWGWLGIVPVALA